MKGLVKEDGTTAKAEEKLDFKVVEFNKSSKKIILSHVKTYSDGRKETAPVEEKAEDSEAKNTQKAVKKLKANLEKTTLGDISELAALKDEMEKAQE